MVELKKYAARKRVSTLFLSLFLMNLAAFQGFAQDSTETHIRKKMEITGDLAPKSVVASGTGLFSAQNMMYRHTITLFNTAGERLAEIKDLVKLAAFGYSEYTEKAYAGAPVEGVFTADGKYLWVSNYNMSGGEFTNPGCDDCIGNDYDPSFLYKINTENQQIESVVKVGSVPKFLTLSPDEKSLFVSNWVSSDISVINLEEEKEIKRITVGPHPRGIAISSDNKTAFVTLMGSTKLAEVNLETYDVNYIPNLGKSPRSVILAAHDSVLFVSFNSSNTILKYNRFSAEATYCKTLAGPRSMTLTPDENHLYVVNYFDDAFTKINTTTMTVEAEIKTASKPIGICGNWPESEIWVACYSGKIEIFKDFKLENEMHPPTLFGLTFPLRNTATQKTVKTVDTIETLLIEPIDIVLTNYTPKVKMPQATPLKVVKPKLENPVTGNFHVIIGAFGVHENAEKRQAELLALGLKAEILPGNKLHYVSAQRFDSREKAEEEKNEIAKRVPNCGNPWILKWDE